MKLVGDLYFPDSEKHFVQYGRDVVDYQKPQRDKAFEYVTDWRTCIDLGANVGIFSRHFACHFDRVIAVEPVRENIACLKLNVPSNVEILEVAVGDAARNIQMRRTPKNVGGAFVRDLPETLRPSLPDTPELMESVPMIAVDSLGLDGVGLIKLDIQGSELIALQGCRETLLRSRPVVLIEEKPIGGKDGSVDHIEGAANFLIGCGMIAKEKVGADRVYVF